MFARAIICVLILLLVSGCCSSRSREALTKAQVSLQQTQAYYDYLVGALVIDPFSPELKAAAIAADSALKLCGMVQRAWCPDLEEAKQAELQAQEAQRKAAQAGVR